jgi:hypothetical protein
MKKGFAQVSIQIACKAKNIMELSKVL